jgi:hypothetical protein
MGKRKPEKSDKCDMCKIERSKHFDLAGRYNIFSHKFVEPTGN